MHVHVDQREIFRSEREIHSCFLPRLKADAFKSAQLQHRARYGCYPLVNIQLRHFIAGTIASIRDVNRDLNGSGRTNGLGFRPEIVEVKLRITEAVAEGEQRITAVEQVAAVARGLVIIEIWKLPDRTRKCDRQFSTGIDVAE